MSKLIKAFALAMGLVVSSGNAKAQASATDLTTPVFSGAVEATLRFDPFVSTELFNLARAPVDIEQSMARGLSMAEATRGVRDTFPIHSEYTVLRHKNSTALVLYDKDREDIHVSFDGGNERQDIIDDMKFWKRKHPLGGKVHHGYYSAVLKQNEEGVSLIDAVREQVEIYAAQNDKQKHLSVTGFSRGGSMAIVAGAQWIVEDFANDERLKMQTIYSFGNPAAGNKKFCAALQEKAEERKIDITLLVIGNDPMPHILSPTSPWYMPGSFNHPGNVYYMGFNKENTLNFLENPERETVQNFRKESPEMKWHALSVYEAMLQTYIRATEPKIDLKNYPRVAMDVPSYNL